MGTQTVQQGMAEPEAGLDAGGVLPVDPVLRGDANDQLRGELERGGAAVPVGLPEERDAGPNVGAVGVEVHAAGGGGRWTALPHRP